MTGFDILSLQYLIAAGLCCLQLSGAPAPTGGRPQEQPDAPKTESYVLGAGDSIRIWVLGLEELFKGQYRVDQNGMVDLPLFGQVQAGGSSLSEFRGRIEKLAEKEAWNPKVSVEIAEFGSQPVTVIGAVNTPGTHQLQGRRTLAEAISSAGGLKPDAGHSIRITRSLRHGAIPLPGARLTEDGAHSIAEVGVKELLSGGRPELNIAIKPHDVISAPQAELVYVMGQVMKPGGFVLRERETVSVMQALAMAEGLSQVADPRRSRILRQAPGMPQRQEIQIDLKAVMSGKGEDLALRPHDILFIPGSTGKQVFLRTLEAAFQAGTGVVIWRR